MKHFRNFTVLFFFKGGHKRVFVVPANSALEALQGAAQSLSPDERGACDEVQVHAERGRPLLRAEPEDDLPGPCYPYTEET